MKSRSTAEVMRRAQRKKAVIKVGGDQIRLVPMFSRVGGDASHGSHRYVVHISLGQPGDLDL